MTYALKKTPKSFIGYNELYNEIQVVKTYGDGLDTNILRIYQLNGRLSLQEVKEIIKDILEIPTYYHDYDCSGDEFTNLSTISRNHNYWIVCCHNSLDY